MTLADKIEAAAKYLRRDWGLLVFPWLFVAVAKALRARAGEG